MAISDQSLALEAARAGAEVVRAGFGSIQITTWKGDANPVTEIDHAAEEAILQIIHRTHPGDQAMAEESGGEDWEAGRVWIIDPLDGTVNFIHGIPHLAVSVALWNGGRPSVAVVIDVIHGEEFAAVSGEGATLNRQPIRVSAQESFAHSLIATGFPYDRNLHAQGYTDNVAPILERAQGVRRFGSAALDLAWVAAGRYEGYWEFGIAPWDTAAGALLIMEAGGVVTNHRNEAYRPGDVAVVGSNGHIHVDFIDAVGRRVPGHIE
jgi:myo-inositol-1(or 4)-monophosphatase